ncbi:uncharacterized protein I303_107454 [Kwoniella dejecticola CBS 10117]|uniref:AB hydrolase-1 domain-containing protein n=1 Tax=Kwoniella dejecticola CBS 10117 TaxID=1296121 RepID=A0A1A5ZZQ1_9TREE|nr:uncharacterized protein I303_06858 [Kwoniella dejecticola CBS 10117]OBR83295.1 hypothetical protein I303_06858 [Kwoniella dejecticola CBS 10117]
MLAVSTIIKLHSLAFNMSTIQQIALLSLLAVLGNASPIIPRSNEAEVKPPITWVNCSEAIPLPIQQANITLPGTLPESLKCGIINVPLDYSKPMCETNNLNISFAFNSVNSKHGLLAYNAGGPGEEVQSYAWGLAGIPIEQSDHVAGLEEFDFLAMDTRGTWASNALSCPEPDFYAPIAPPKTQEEYETLSKNVKNYTSLCAENSLPKGIFEHVGSDAVAQDLESLREVLGYDKLNYLGYSYGTIYGQEYLNRFADKAGQFVLDGVATVSISNYDIVNHQGRAFDRLIERADKWCQSNNDTCPLAALGNGSVPATFKQVMEQYANSTDTPSADIAGLLSIGLFSGNPLFESFTGALALAATGNTSALHYTDDFAAAFTQSSLSATLPTLCSDFKVDNPSWEGYNDLIEKVHHNDKYGGSDGIFYLAIAMCASFPTVGTSDLKWRYTNVTDHPTLLATSDYDLNTPTELTDVTRQYNPNSTMLVRHGDDHGSFFVPGPVRDAMLAYFYNATIPAPCEGDVHSVYAVGTNRTGIVDPYVAPIGEVAGDVIE